MNKTLWNLWLSYAAFYFGRVNLSIVIPVLLATYGDLSLYNVGFVASGFMLTYAIGQFLHGQISEKFNPYTYIALGLIGSAVMNAILGFSAGFFWMLLIGEMLDGGFQSMGWSSTVRANAYTSKNVERDTRFLGTAYQAGNSIAWVASGFVIGQFGWEWGFWLASIVMVVRAVTLLATKPEFKFEAKKLSERVKLTLDFPIVMSGLSLCLLNMARYGVITWIPTFLFREYAMPIERVGLTVFLIPAAGILGTLAYNKMKWSSDLLSVVWLIGLGMVFLLLPHFGMGWTIALLLLSGFFLYGPHVFLVTTMPSRFKDKNIVAASCGYIDGWGYIGSVVVGILVPFILDRTGSWTSVFYFWAAASFAIVGLIMAVYLKTKKS